MSQSPNPLVEPTPLVESNSKPKRYCAAKSKRTGLPCRDWAMIGRTTCYHHGGVPNSGPLKHGRKSRLRYVFGEKYDSLATNEELLGFEDDIKLFLARESELLGMIEGGKPDEGTWSRLLELSERRTRLVERAISSMTKIEDAITTRYAIVIMGRILEIVEKEAGKDVSGRVALRLQSELIGSTPR